nr:NADH-quinone oxidoreductase subunit C [Streptomyces bathyalis]
MPESATTPAGWLPDGAEALFGEGARAEEAYGLLTVDVPPGSWIPALETARDALGCRFFDWLSAVDEPGTGFQVCAHVAALPDAGRPGGPVHRLLLRTTVPHEAPVLATATGVFAGAAWHERETHEMFGVAFTDHPDLTPLLLPESFEGHPLRKDFVLAARVAKAWPGAVEPGESSHGAPKRRQMLPPGVPDPNEWGPLKGQLPPVPSRPARGRAGRAGAAERPARRARSASAGSASQRGAGETGEPQDDGARQPGERAGQPSEQAGQPSEQHPARDRAQERAPEQAQDGAQDRAQDGAQDQATDRTREQPPEEKRTPGASGASPASDAPWHDARPAKRDSGGGRDASDGDRGEGDGGDAGSGSGDGQTEEGA